MVMDYLRPLHQAASWRTKRENDWSITPQAIEKSTTGYVGLKNLGCICYMNSMLQQLFMIPPFRAALLRCEDPKKDVTPKEDNLLYQLQCMFGALLESEKQYFNPKQFCHAFKDWDGNPTNVLEQMDVDEFFNIIMDRIEFAMKGTREEKVIADHFAGKFDNQLICKGCPHYSERSEPFLSVSLNVKNKKSVHESLTSFVEGEMLEGNNAYLCEKCDKKVDTLKRTCIKRLPKVLILVLKRFEFDFETMQKHKLNDLCEFPHELNMLNYTAEGLAILDHQKEAKRKREAGEEVDSDEEDGQGDHAKLPFPKEYYEYNLKGIVVHTGTADSGHYYSFIQDREDPDSTEGKQPRWYEFNDTWVTEFDPKDIPVETFGGEEKFDSSYPMMNFKHERSSNAYVVFYERATDYTPPTEEDLEQRVKDDQEKEKEAKQPAAPAPATDVDADGDIQMVPEAP